MMAGGGENGPWFFEIAEEHEVPHGTEHQARTEPESSTRMLMHYPTCHALYSVRKLLSRMEMWTGILRKLFSLFPCRGIHCG